MHITQMPIAPPALLQAGRVVSLPHSVTTRALCDAPLLRVACNSDGALGFLSADLSSLAVDPQTMGRDATRGRKAPGRTRARPAQAGRAEISKWDIDSRFHESSRVCSHLCGSRSCLRGNPPPADATARYPQVSSQTLPPRGRSHNAVRLVQKQSRASDDLSPCGERSRWQLRTTGGEVP